MSIGAACLTSATWACRECKHRSQPLACERVGCTNRPDHQCQRGNRCSGRPFPGDIRLTSTGPSRTLSVLRSSRSRGKPGLTQPRSGRLLETLRPVGRQTRASLPQSSRLSRPRIPAREEPAAQCCTWTVLSGRDQVNRTAIVVGTGGAHFTGLRSQGPCFAQREQIFGVLELTLQDGDY